MKLTLQSLVRNHTNFLSTHYRYNNVVLQASNDQPAAYLHGNNNYGTKSGGKVLVLLQFKKFIKLMHFGVVDCNQAALLRTGILVAVSGILLF